ncbi:helix-turn-helix transcriptional regulator [Roseomonas populi]|uniref:Helix-turn-helix transcriptional regulator n=1 Tax=Roseomonas populi TaxID=3121582 RepID=A0ABT1XC73_9PROT|nr:helix-turn-helix transcriptional regulator [Roseomonas pecuniae]MCR0985008.1 helix-turn-helix transcriptional regulator [Roseomonas pecuniae]
MLALHAPRVPDDAGQLFSAVTHAVMAIGEHDFEGLLLQALRPIAGVHHCSVFLIEGGRGVSCLGAASSDGTSVSRKAAERYISSYWQEDPGLRRVGGVSFASHAGLRRISSGDIRNPAYRRECYDTLGIVERATLYRDFADCRLVLSLHRTSGDGQFRPDELRALASVADPITAAVARHHRLRIAATERRTADPARLPTLLAALVPELSERELEVCSLTVLGHGTEAIAARLGLRPSSITTYRKRAYCKAGVNSAAELAALCLEHFAGAE